ncbi:DDE-type integrase/transposase/recombinase [Nocardia sp. Root136]|uniref:DDE-type integrase/transposase/recombinase n=1 Tax=Nocardia sp. Root136 TaxID=1736458 RepID=UPI0022864E64|nr:DDE-type integrase/transposase/recombinase [Nocardia sp. Root136]
MPPASSAVRVCSGWPRSGTRSRTPIVGWKCSDRCDTEVVLGALEYAVWTRDVRDGQLVHHSDRGSTYTAIRFANRLADNGIAQSMGSVGDSYDDALMENFFSSLKTELVYRNSWRTREDAENAWFAYIETSHQHRMSSRSGNFTYGEGIRRVVDPTCVRLHRDISPTQDVKPQREFHLR